MRSRWSFPLSFCFLLGAFPLFAQNVARQPVRDAQVIEILNRVVAAAGGSGALTRIHDFTESGEITLYWGKDIKGPVKIRALGGNHIRIDADLPNGKSTWIVSDGGGSKREGDKTSSISANNAVNLGNLTFPVGHVLAALADSTAEVRLVRIEKREDRPIYHLRLKGRLGLVSADSPLGPISKDILVDALTFDILSVQDQPYRTYKVGRRSDSPPRDVEFADFRTVAGIRLPLSISTTLQGQQAMSIQLRQVTFNTNLTDGDFQPQK